LKQLGAKVVPTDPGLLLLARAVLARNQQGLRDSTWDKRGTDPETLSQRPTSLGTAKNVANHNDNPSVPLSHALGDGTVGQAAKSGTELGTSGPYRDVFVALCSKCPELVESDRWQQAIRDGDTFLAAWGEQARALGWTACELLGLHALPAGPHPNYRRLSRYDETGLIWLLRGRRVVALTETTAAIQGATAVLIYRKLRKPPVGPVGDSLDDFEARPVGSIP
jgi:hypothetical protein